MSHHMERMMAYEPAAVLLETAADDTLWDDITQIAVLTDFIDEMARKGKLDPDDFASYLRTRIREQEEEENEDQEVPDLSHRPDPDENDDHVPEPPFY